MLPRQQLDKHVKLTGTTIGRTISGKSGLRLASFVVAILVFGRGRAAAADLMIGSEETGEKDCGGSPREPKRRGDGKQEHRGRGEGAIHQSARERQRRHLEGSARPEEEEAGHQRARQEKQREPDEIAPAQGPGASRSRARVDPKRERSSIEVDAATCGRVARRLLRQIQTVLKLNTGPANGLVSVRSVAFATRRA
jgi:hypothetical protein